MKNKTSLLLGSATMCLLAYFAGCSSSSNGDDDDDKDNGGEGGGSDTGGKGGTKSGGKGGSSNGGSGSGGSGSGGSGSGGSNAGNGGSSAAGNGGSAAGGSMGGTAGGSAGVGGDVPAIGANPFFSGKDMTVTKLVATDAMPGKFYSPVNSVPTGPKVVEVTDTAGLPPGVKYAMQFDRPAGTMGTFIVGWNWRENKSGEVWNWADLSPYAGFAFYMKAMAIQGFENAFLYDEGSVGPETYGGTCSATPVPPATTATCPISAKQGIVARTTWRRELVKFSYLTPTPTAAQLMKMGRVDLLRSIAEASANTIWITGVELLKEADFPPAEL